VIDTNFMKIFEKFKIFNSRITNFLLSDLFYMIKNEFFEGSSKLTKDFVKNIFFYLIYYYKN
jgi:hypothetical protein